MTHPKKVAFRISAYGLFLVVCGLVGFVLTSEQSTSALMNGAVGGVLMVVLGFLHRQGRHFTLPAASGAAGIFTVTFVWRSIVQWTTTSADVHHIPLAFLLTGMTMVSGVMTMFLIRQMRV